ncbi:MAG: hypothetical protein EOP56_02980 [Sphingobacteriales bacterium]|nr:MAG: hypothetical protein EOP56_02980 [Sphingobacteriales bacterium]
MQNSFYYWQFNAPATDSFSSGAASLGVEHFYLHYMDVGWDDRLHVPVPIAQLQTRQWAGQIPVMHTPVVFITKKVFRNISDAWCDTLAEKISIRINKMSEEMTKTSPKTDMPNEIQIDCDWTAQSKEKYFTFLKKLKSINPSIKISATIRMYPYKYSDKMGVPPVDQGVLMCYNLGQIRDKRTHNSIFELAELKKYFRKDRYPLPLDIALPVFGWHVWFREQQLKGILYEMPAQLPASAFSLLKQGQYQVTKDTVWQGQYLREGDLLRSEYPEAASLQAAAELLKKEQPDYRRIIFFHWSSTNVYTYERLIKEIYSAY